MIHLLIQKILIDFEIYTELCKIGDLNSAIKNILILQERGFSVMDILDSYFFYIKYTDTIAENIKYEIVKILCKYITIFHNIHEDEIELSLFTNEIIILLNNNIKDDKSNI